MKHVPTAVLAAVVLVCRSSAHADPNGLMPSNQHVSAAGHQINLGLFPSAVALSHDGAFLAV
ncbi:MAG TPA: hypothetical protein VLV86_01000, partial [Vicinamibacterales bacterium]|nr:hypothetical protein [Vicinamibacterales bacterium]